MVLFGGQLEATAESSGSPDQAPPAERHPILPGPPRLQSTVLASVPSTGCGRIHIRETMASEPRVTDPSSGADFYKAARRIQVCAQQVVMPRVFRDESKCRARTSQGLHQGSGPLESHLWKAPELCRSYESQSFAPSVQKPSSVPSKHALRRSFPISATDMPLRQVG